MTGATVIELTSRLRRHDPAVTRVGTPRPARRQPPVPLLAAERELGFTYHPLAQAIADKAARYRNHGMLPPGPHISPGSTAPRTQQTCLVTRTRQHWPHLTR